MRKKVIYSASLILLLGMVSNAWAQPFANQDVGNPALAGNVSYDPATDAWTVQGAGNDIWDTSDQFHYVFRPLAGDGSAVVRITSMDITHEWAKVGVMIRETLDGNSKHAMVSMTGTHGVQTVWREQTGGGSEGATSQIALPIYVKIERIGDTVNTYATSHPAFWIPQQSMNIPMDPNVYIGLFVCSHSDEALCTTVFDRLDLVAPAQNAAWAVSPSDGAIVDLAGTTITWMPGDTAASHNVYFGTTSPPPLIGNQTETTYDTGPLEGGATYYYRIDEVECLGPTCEMILVHAGELRFFTTEACAGDCSPAYDPNQWNWDPNKPNSRTTQLNNNCYNYACNKKTNTFAQPGRAGGYNPKKINCEEYIKAAKADGLTPIGKDEACPECKFKKALVIAENVDYHWYRHDACCNWSHKPGQTQATNKDASGKQITDPEKADRGNYDKFCGYFCCDSDTDKVNIKSLETVRSLEAEAGLWASMTIFSGREDPKWEISSPNDIATLRGFLQALPSANRPNWPDLGWRGVMLLNTGIPDFPLWIHVFSGVIRINDAGGSQYYEDVHGMETWLLKHMPDWDSDGLPSPEEGLLFTDPTSPDTDGDLVSDGPGDPDGPGPIIAGPDNCPTEYNPDQADTDGDGVGDACEEIIAIVVDDFEGCNDDCNRIFYTWRDGSGHSGDPACGVAPYPGNGTGSTVGHPEPPYAEQAIVHEGRQSMPFEYVNDGSTGKALYSETERMWATPQDWTAEGVKALTLYLHGDANNEPERIYVAVGDAMGTTAVVAHPNREAVHSETWQEWNIDLTEFAKAGVNLQSIKKMYIGVGNRVAPELGGTGTLYIDDIRLCPPPTSVYKYTYLGPDLNADDNVDWADVGVFAEQWLDEGCWPGDWCGRADFDRTLKVDFADFSLLAQDLSDSADYYALICARPEPVDVALDDDGTWKVPDWRYDAASRMAVPYRLTPGLWEGNIMVAQSPAPGTVFDGPQVVDVVFTAMDEGTGFEECTVKVNLVDRTPPLVTISGVSTGDRFVAPAVIVPSFDVFDAGDPSPELSVLLDGELYIVGTPITSVGLHTLRVAATDNSGNLFSPPSVTFIISEVPEYRGVAVVERFNCSSGPGGAPTIDANIFVASAFVDVREINLYSVGLWVLRDDGLPLNDIPIPIAGSSSPTGGYDYTTAEAAYQKGYWNLHFCADLIDYISCLDPNVSVDCPIWFELTGTGNNGEPNEFDFVAKTPVQEDPNAEATLADLGLTNDDPAQSPPEEPRCIPCEWKMTLDEAPKDSDPKRVPDTCLGGTQDAEIDLWAEGGKFGGKGRAKDECTGAAVATAAVVGKAIMKVWLEPLNHCCKCKITCIHQPSFKSRVRMDPPSECYATGKISIASTCGGSVTIKGGVQLGHVDPIVVNLGVSASTSGEASVDVSTTLKWEGTNEDTDAPSGNMTAETNKCSIVTSIVSSAKIKVRADAHLFNWYAECWADLWDASPGITVNAICHPGDPCCSDIAEFKYE